MTRLARRGHRVLYVEPFPAPRPRRGRRSARCGRHFRGWRDGPLPAIEPRLWVYQGQSSPWEPAGGGANAGRWRRALRGAMPASAASATGDARALSAGAMAGGGDRIRADLLCRRRVDGVRGIHPGAAPSAAGRRGSPAATIRCGTGGIAATAGAIFGTAAAIVPAGECGRYRTLLSRDARHRGAVHPAPAALPRPRLGFVGQIDERLDQSLPLRLAQEHPPWQLAPVGRVRDGVDVSALASTKNILLAGYVPYAQLPGNPARDRRLPVS